MPDRLRTARPRAQLRQGRNDWYRITNSTGTPGAATIHVYDEIGYWGITAADFVRELSSLNATTIDLHINSPGGEIFDGIAIMNALRSHPATVTTYVDAIAASIASVIAMAGDRIVMAPHSQLMIHDGSALCVGNAANMRETAELLDRQSDNIAAVYAERAGGDVAEWRARMTAETWYTAAEAVAAGLADEIASTQTSADDNSPENLWDLSIFAYAGRAAAPAPVPVATAPVAEEGEPTEAPAAEPAPVEAEAEPAIEAPAGTEPAAPTDDPAPTVTADDWASITAHLINPAPSTGDAFARLREALL
jgi:ATP-dependent protease ClpP protease subunit